MTRLQTQAAALAVAALLMLLVLIVALRSSEPPSVPPDSPPPAPSETPEQKAAREAAQPRPTPDRIILTWKGDPTTTQAVTWRTDTTVARAGAQIALADPGPGVEPGWNGFEQKKVGYFTARTEPLKTALNQAHYHSVNFEGLRPNTRYMYRVGDGTAWSEWFHFDTAATTPEPFGFIYFGDAQNGIKSLWSRVARGAYSDMPKARFIIHAGDLVNSGSDDAEWGEWHTAAGWINGTVPSVPTPGNHEFAGGKLTAHWRPQFTLPENSPPGLGLEETCFYFDFQGTRIISLNSNEKGAEQVPWLERVLESRPSTIRWTVVTFHHPLYALAPGRDNKALRQMWRPVLEKYNVDLVLQGHDHGYGRSGLMRGDNLLSGDQGRGTVYAVSVSGSKMYTLDKLSWAKRSKANLQLYQLIRIDGGVLKYESRTARGELFDAFELHKRPDGNQLIELDVPAPPPSDAPSWPQVAPLVVRRPAAPEPPTPTAAPEGSGEYGRGLVAAIILGTIVLGVAAAIRTGGRKPRAD